MVANICSKTNQAQINCSVTCLFLIITIEINVIMNDLNDSFKHYIIKKQTLCILIIVCLSF